MQYFWKTGFFAKHRFCTSSSQHVDVYRWFVVFCLHMLYSALPLIGKFLPNLEWINQRVTWLWTLKTLICSFQARPRFSNQGQLRVTVITFSCYLKYTCTYRLTIENNKICQFSIVFSLQRVVSAHSYARSVGFGLEIRSLNQISLVWTQNLNWRSVIQTLSKFLLAYRNSGWHQTIFGSFF